MDTKLKQSLEGAPWDKGQDDTWERRLFPGDLVEDNERLPGAEGATWEPPERSTGETRRVGWRWTSGSGPPVQGQ